MRIFSILIFLLLLSVGYTLGQTADTTQTDTTVVSQQDSKVPFFQRLFPFLGGNKKKKKSSEKESGEEENPYDGFSQQKINKLFYEASMKGDTDLMLRLLDEGAIIDVKNRHGRTPLIEAARRGDYKVVKFLIDYGANINTRDNYDATALTYASRSGHSQITNLLLNYGAR